MGWGRVGREAVDTETHTLGHCAQLCRLCTAQRDSCLRNHGFMYLNDNFPAASRKVVLTTLLDYNFSTGKVFCGKDALFKFAQSAYGSVVARHRGQEGKGSSFLPCVHTHAHTLSHSLSQASRDQEDGQEDK